MELYPQILADSMPKQKNKRYKRMVLTELLAAIVASYITYLSIKIDKRQDRIEIDIALIRASLDSKMSKKGD